jgi:hypothetical protein
MLAAKSGKFPTLIQQPSVAICSTHSRAEAAVPETFADDGLSSQVHQALERAKVRRASNAQVVNAYRGWSRVSSFCKIVMICTLWLAFCAYVQRLVQVISAAFMRSDVPVSFTFRPFTDSNAPRQPNIPRARPNADPKAAARDDPVLARDIPVAQVPPPQVEGGRTARARGQVQLLEAAQLLRRRGRRAGRVG